jgi:NAD(P)-dependent dehydrogenase (short-subunit alcohol dehydrogenase family)
MARWFITGASKGIGRCIVRQLLDRGEHVAATARKPETLEQLTCDRLWTGRLDVTDPEQIPAIVEAAWTALGGIDVIVNNAGYGLFGAAEEVTDSQLMRELATNLLGPIRVNRAFLPRLRAQGGGRIINIGSVGGQIATPGFSSYNTSKWGLEGYSEALAHEVAAFGIGVTIVEPGGVQTDFGGASMEMADAIEAYATTPQGQVRAYFESGQVDAQAVGDPDKVAAAIIEVAGQDAAPLRLTLGSDAYTAMYAALSGKLSALEAGKGIAHTSDRDVTVASDDYSQLFARDV